MTAMRLHRILCAFALSLAVHGLWSPHGWTGEAGTPNPKGLVSVIEESGGAHQDERSTGIAWLTIELEPGEKAANLVVTNCKSSLC